MTERDYMVADLKPDHFRTLPSPKRMTYEEAVAKALELAEQYPERDFVVLGVFAVAKKTVKITIEPSSTVVPLRTGV